MSLLCTGDGCASGAALVALDEGSVRGIAGLSRAAIANTGQSCCGSVPIVSSEPGPAHSQQPDVTCHPCHMEHTPMNDNNTPRTELQARRERLVLDHFADETRQDFDAVLGTFPHPHYELIPSGEVHDGIADVRQYYADTRRAFPDQRHEIIQLRHADDSVVVEFWLLGTHRGPLKGLPPTGNSFRCRMNAFFIFEGDRLVCERVYFDTLTMLRQLLAGVPAEHVAALVGGLLGQPAATRAPEAAAA
jgi:steroid delta-isomerase-like uncharacterized protein